MATPPLHLSIVGCIISSIPRPIYLPDLQQSLLKAFQLKDTLPLAYWRETFQVPSPRMWQGVQREE